MGDSVTSKEVSGTHRIRLLVWALAACMATLGVSQHKAIARAYRLHLSPLSHRCTAEAPDWLSHVGDWARHHGFSHVQVYALIDGQSADCAFGQAATPAKSDPGTALPYASLTKVLTSTLALLAVQRGTLDQDAAIHELLASADAGGSSPERWKAITLRMLLQHRGGFDRHVSGDPMLSVRPPCPGRDNALATIRIDFAPDSRFAYSNLGYCLIGLALERSTHSSFEAVLARDISDPMRLSSIGHLDADNSGAWQRELSFASAAEQDQFRALNWTALKSVGSATGSARDFGMFLQALRGEGELGMAGRRLLQPLSDCDDSHWRACHGLAFYSYREAGQERMYWHDGSLPGVTAFAAISESGNTFVLLANGRDPDAWLSVNDGLGRWAYRLLSGSQPGII